MTRVQRNTLDFEMLSSSHLFLDHLENGVKCRSSSYTWSLSLGRSGRTAPGGPGGR